VTRDEPNAERLGEEIPQASEESDRKHGQKAYYIIKDCGSQKKANLWQHPLIAQASPRVCESEAVRDRGQRGSCKGRAK
jgi:hypothetical protein